MKITTTNRARIQPRHQHHDAIVDAYTKINATAADAWHRVGRDVTGTHHFPQGWDWVIVDAIDDALATLDGLRADDETIVVQLAPVDYRQPVYDATHHPNCAILGRNRIHDDIRQFGIPTVPVVRYAHQPDYPRRVALQPWMGVNTESFDVFVEALCAVVASGGVVTGIQLTVNA